MITTSTPINNTNHCHQKTELFSTDHFDDNDNLFYETLKTDLDALKRDPSEEVIERILAYSRGK